MVGTGNAKKTNAFFHKLQVNCTFFACEHVRIVIINVAF